MVICVWLSLTLHLLHAASEHKGAFPGTTFILTTRAWRRCLSSTTRLCSFSPNVIFSQPCLALHALHFARVVYARPQQSAVVFAVDLIEWKCITRKTLETVQLHNPTLNCTTRASLTLLSLSSMLKWLGPNPIPPLTLSVRSYIGNEMGRLKGLSINKTTNNN